MKHKKTSYVSAAAFALGISGGIGAWWVMAADDLQPGAAAAGGAVDSAGGVGETEAVVELPATSDETSASNSSESATALAQSDGREPIGGVVPAVRATPAREASYTAAARGTRGDTSASSHARVDVTPASNERVNRDPADSAFRIEPAEEAPARSVERPEAAAPRFIELTVPSNAILGVRLNTGLSSDTAEIEDRVEATLTRDVIAEGRVAIPAGTKLLGSVNTVTRGGKFRERARLGVRFHTLVLADGTRESIRVDSILREGDSPARESAAKIGGGAIGGAIIGGIMGGRKGAVLGGAAGAGAGTAVVAAGDRSVATLEAGSPLSIRLDAPVIIRREQ